jgi:phosphatidylethanolamine/phosphatidyl-N-methylethanolamine N-methyltransferase
MSHVGPRDYNHLAPFYDHIFHGILNEGHELIGHILSGERPLRGKRVLEVGVGSGLTLNYLPRSIEYTGVDINEHMLELANKKMKSLGRRNYRLELMDAEHLRFKKESFDFVIAASVLTAVQDPEHTMKEMIRVTKRGGKIAIVANMRQDGNLRSSLFKRFDSFTKRYLGFRMDLHSDSFTQFESIRLIGQMDVNKIMGIPLSSFLIFEKL